MSWGLTQKEDQILSVQTGLVWKEAEHNAASSQRFLYLSAKSSYTMLSNKGHSSLSQRQELAGNTSIISAMERKWQREWLKGDRQFLWGQTSKSLRADQLLFSIPGKKGWATVVWVLYNRRELPHWLLKTNKPKWIKISVLCQILRLCKSGKFCGFLSREMLTDSGYCMAEHPTGRTEADSETCSAVKRGQRRARAHDASWQLFGLY